MRIKVFFYLSLFICFIQANAQTTADCVDAMDICSKETIQVSMASQSGDIQETLGEVCEFDFLTIDTETNAVWFKYSFATDGDFIFRITSSSEKEDIDFYVFQSEDNTCSELNSIRCMLSGENVGSPTNPVCLGATGLAFGSTDLIEGPGCQDGDDNFLAPLQVEAGDIFYLLIIDFSSIGFFNFTVEHDGSADLVCDETSSSTSRIVDNLISVSPNPFTENLQINTLDAFSPESKIEILDVHGRVIHLSQMSNKLDLELSWLNAGIYFLRYSNKKGEVGIKKIIKK